ncbi:GNAT family N-acetyltransferase [Geomicrobium sp. JCM 19038]|uniref:GNAT family N-acetyltransferase n=1 Tax=Geomicrobium sp. JCM 19038 TaxID=1460635 RepID=UPI00045F184F|nr:GNAT family N-acetyltransferase [Geomicrobium sp. JCM 19038]GAK09769.1 GCN5-related N-acetyltransferase [Geomicrobium sp. JCM 19038]
MNVHIREIKLEDAKQVAHVHVSSWKTTYPGIVPTSFLNRLQVDERATLWESRINAGMEMTYVASNDQNEIIGFISIGRSKNVQAHAQVYALYLLEDVQRKGIGKALMKRAMEDFYEQGYQSFVVEALVENPSMAFYRALRPIHYSLSTFVIHKREIKEWVMTFSVARVRQQLAT